ncbi:MAG TPA: SDR family NAD(P)-dependent oxidoreductase [Ktedonobacterales bacterium]
MALDDFAGAVAVVTGGASGIGLATATALRVAGAHVVLADVNAAGLRGAAERLRADAPDVAGQIVTAVTDVTDLASVGEMTRQALGVTGRLDLVIACAGIGRGGAVETFPAAEMEAMMRVNFMGIYHTVQAALPPMRQQGRGHIVLLSSVAGKLGAPLLSGYCATKWAVRGFAIALRSELYGTGVGVTTVYPAWVDTPMVGAEGLQTEGLQIEVLLKPEQVAAAILGAVRAGQRDLTLAPNPDIARLIELTRDDPDQAEDRAGKAYYRRTHPQPA